MKRSKKFLGLALLLPMLATAGCGNGGKQEAAANTAAETIGAKADENPEPDALETESGTKDEKADRAEKAEGKRVSSNKDMYIYLTNLELDDEEGTAYLRLLNRTKDRTISVTVDKVRIDSMDGEWQSDEVTLAGGESKDTVVHFSRPNFGDDGKTLSECAYIKFSAAAPGLYGEENVHVTFYVKGDKELAKAIDESAAASAVDTSVILIEEQMIYNENGIVVTVPAQTVSDKDGFSVHIENNTDDTMFFYYENVTVNGVLLQERRQTYPDMTAPGWDLDVYIDFMNSDGENTEKMQRDIKSGEISFTLGDAGLEKEFPLTLKYTR